MEVSDSFRLLIALAGLALSLVVALLTWIAVRVEQRHKREGDETRAAIERAVRYGKALGKAELRAAMRHARDAADEVLGGR